MSDLRNLVTKLDDVVQHAKSNVPLYRLLYAGVGRIRSLDDFSRLPRLTKKILLNERLEDTLMDLSELCISRTFDDKMEPGNYVPRLLSYHDVLEEFSALSSMMRFAGLKGKQRIMLIADEQHTYAVAELGKQLAFYEQPLAAFILRSMEQVSLDHALHWFKPTVVFLDSETDLSIRSLPRSVKSLLRFNEPNRRKSEASMHRALESFDIFRDSWFGPAAIRRSGHAHYTFDSGHFYFETGTKQTLLVTSFISRMQPVIRYELPYQGIVSSSDTFICKA